MQHFFSLKTVFQVSYTHPGKHQKDVEFRFEEMGYDYNILDLRYKVSIKEI